jgi:hypothetical protein
VIHAGELVNGFASSERVYINMKITSVSSSVKLEVRPVSNGLYVGGGGSTLGLGSVVMAPSHMHQNI